MASPLEAWIHTLSDWDELAERLLAHAGGRKKFFFYGEMGAGKTTLVQALCRKLGAEDKALSPSFALVNEYAAPEGPIRHLDLFRLKNEQEALDIGVEDYLYDAHYCFVEWPGHIEDLAPNDVVRIQIRQEGDSVRKVLFL